MVCCQATPRFNTKPISLAGPTGPLSMHLQSNSRVDAIKHCAQQRALLEQGAQEGGPCWWRSKGCLQLAAAEGMGLLLLDGSALQYTAALRAMSILTR